MTRGTTSLLWLCALAFAACQTDEAWEVPMADSSFFEKNVYPVLLRDCAFHTCHGSTDRFFRVWGPGRVRIGDLSAFAEKTPLEVNTSFQRAISLIDSDDPRRSLLLRKPLATEAGGAGHLGADKFGRNVYRTIDSPGYVTLSRWVFSVKNVP
jgi:hypothetical protein